MTKTGRLPTIALVPFARHHDRRYIAMRVAALLWLATGCPRETLPEPTRPPAGGLHRGCTEIGCGPSWLLEFSRRGQWPIGDYEIDLVLDGEAVRCESTIPLQCDDIPSCPTDRRVQVIESGCALGVGAQRLEGVQFIGRMPTDVDVRVIENGNLVAEGRYTPTYSKSRPNGPECEPECTMARNGALVLAPGLGDPIPP